MPNWKDGKKDRERERRRDRERRERRDAKKRRGILRAAARAVKGLPKKKSLFEVEADKLARERTSEFVAECGEAATKVLSEVRDAVYDVLVSIHRKRECSDPGARKKKQYERLAQLVTEKFARRAEAEDEIVFATRKDLRAALYGHSIETLGLSKKVAQAVLEGRS